ncbi:MAG: DHH family phosphoesterase [Nanoarchaeota archaeon]|nr:DHH family phosphoesterase [Nanoarchaeota archaeon]
MLTKKQVNEIKEILQNSSNPLFLFDNDPDGLCSFLLLQRYAGRGKGVPIKSFPALDEVYFRKIEELEPDCLFILDKPVVSKDFFDRVRQVNLPIVWIDHHEINKKDIPRFVKYYNPLFNRKKSEEPVTALCYQVNNSRDLMWLAVAGCVSDSFLPDFYHDFRKNYPDLSVEANEAFDVFYRSQIGKIARMFSFGLKDTMTNVVNMIRFLVKASTPYEVLEDSSKNHTMHRKFEQIEGKYQKLLKKAERLGGKSGKIMFFEYGGELSISSDLANELCYRFPNKTVVVIYLSGVKANISVRGDNIREKLVGALNGLQDSSGGGHKNAAGGRVNIEDLKVFKERFQKLF